MPDINITTLSNGRKPRDPRRDSNGRLTSSERYGKTYAPNHARVMREEDTCHVCGLPVDKTLSGRHPLGPTVDHLVPVAAGGTHDRANLRLAHARCNNQRQAPGVTRPARARPAAQHPGLL